MEELTVEEIIKYAMRIERESYGFYRRASKFLGGSELGSLTDDLAKEEVEHVNQLKSLLDEEIITAEDLNYTVDIDTSMFTQIISTQEIPPLATSSDILHIALGREKDTLSTYDMLLTLTAFNEDVIATLQTLKQMEEMHVKRISERIKKMKSA